MLASCGPLKSNVNARARFLRRLAGPARISRSDGPPRPLHLSPAQQLSAGLRQLTRRAVFPRGRPGLSACGAFPAKPRWRNALLLGAGHIGDVLYNTGSLPALSREAFPECRLHFAAARVPLQKFLPEIRIWPGIDRSINDSRTGRAAGIRLRDPATTARQVGAICCELGGSEFPIVSVMCTRGFSSLVTHPIAFRPPPAHYPAAYFRDLVFAIDRTSLQTGRFRPLIYLGHEAGGPRRECASCTTLDVRYATRPLLACFFTSKQPGGVCPPDQFARALKIVRNGYHASSICLGAPSGRDRACRRLLVEENTDSPPVSRPADSPCAALVCFLRCCTRCVLRRTPGPRHCRHMRPVVPVYFVPNLEFPTGKEEPDAISATETDLAPGVEFVAPTATRSGRRLRSHQILRNGR